MSFSLESCDFISNTTSQKIEDLRVKIDSKTKEYNFRKNDLATQLRNKSEEESRRVEWITYIFSMKQLTDNEEILSSLEEVMNEIKNYQS
jgi:hypothetical protein